MKTPCDASRRLYPGVTICPQLLWIIDRYECGLMKIDGLVGEGYRKELYAGAGCCSGLNSWRQDVKPRMTFDARSSEVCIDSVLQAFLKALGSEFVGGDALTLALFRTKSDLMEYQNYTEEEAAMTISRMQYYITENRSSFLKEFMG